MLEPMQIAMERQGPQWTPAPRAPMIRRRGLLAGSAVLHVAALAMLLGAMPHRQVGTPVSWTLVAEPGLVSQDPIAAPAPVAGTAVRERATVEGAALAPIGRLVVTARAGALRVRPAPRAPLPFAPLPLQSAAPAPAAAAPAAPAAPDEAMVAGLRREISQAVNDARFYPASARMQHRQGRAAVSFVYRDGVVDAVALSESSQSVALDDAALNAVRRARYPAPPAALRGRAMRLTVWVNFTLVAYE